MAGGEAHAQGLNPESFVVRPLRDSPWSLAKFILSCYLTLAARETTPQPLFRIWPSEGRTFLTTHQAL